MDKIDWIVKDNEQGTRLDVFLSRKIDRLSRSGAAQAIQKKMVTVDKRQAKPGLVVRSGDQVSYTIPAVVPAQIPAQNINLQVIYQDRDLAVVAKPAGMVTHPAAGHREGTLVNALLYHLDHLSGIGGEERPGIIHRLDKDTSGLILIAKNDLSHHVLSEALQKRTVKRVYHALTWGRWERPAMDIENQIGRDPKNRKRFTVVQRGGKIAKTGIRLLKQNQWCSLIECDLHTGRTHQIRVHCHHRHHSIIGDRTYGKKGEKTLLQHEGIERPWRQLLHAAILSFQHPTTNEKMVFTCDHPEDFQAFLSAAGLEG